MSDHDWKEATKRPIRVEYRGPYEDPTVVETIEGDFEIDEEYIEEHGGYVIVRGVQGEVYPCALDVFRETYRSEEDRVQNVVPEDYIAKFDLRDRIFYVEDIDFYKGKVEGIMRNTFGHYERKQFRLNAFQKRVRDDETVHRLE